MPTLPRTMIDGTVTHFPYRTAMVQRALISATSDSFGHLWQRLADIAGVEPDNHQVFGVTNAHGTIYFMFSDNRVYVGTDLVVESW